MTEFFATLVDGLTRPLDYFIVPAQRLFIPAILTSLAMAVGAYFYYQRKGKVEGDISAGNMVRYLFPKRIWIRSNHVVTPFIFNRCRVMILLNS